MVARLARTAQRECTNAISHPRAWLIITAKALLVTQMPIAQRETLSRPPAPAPLMPDSPWWALVPPDMCRSPPRSKFACQYKSISVQSPACIWSSGLHHLRPYCRIVCLPSLAHMLTLATPSSPGPSGRCALLPRHTYLTGHPLGSGPSKSTHSVPSHSPKCRRLALLSIRASPPTLVLVFPHMAPNYVPRLLGSVTRQAMPASYYVGYSN